MCHLSMSEGASSPALAAATDNNDHCHHLCIRTAMTPCSLVLRLFIVTAVSTSNPVPVHKTALIPENSWFGSVATDRMRNRIRAWSRCVSQETGAVTV
jgi:hypothetical protein